MDNHDMGATFVCDYIIKCCLVLCLIAIIVLKVALHDFISNGVFLGILIAFFVFMIFSELSSCSLRSELAMRYSRRDPDESLKIKIDHQKFSIDNLQVEKASLKNKLNILKIQKTTCEDELNELKTINEDMLAFHKDELAEQKKKSDFRLIAFNNATAKYDKLKSDIVRSMKVDDNNNITVNKVILMEDNNQFAKIVNDKADELINVEGFSNE